MRRREELRGAQTEARPSPLSTTRFQRAAHSPVIRRYKSQVNRSSPYSSPSHTPFASPRHQQDGEFGLLVDTQVSPSASSSRTSTPELECSRVAADLGVSLTAVREKLLTATRTFGLLESRTMILTPSFLCDTMDYLMRVDRQVHCVCILLDGKRPASGAGRTHESIVAGTSLRTSTLVKRTLHNLILAVKICQSKASEESLSRVSPAALQRLSPDPAALREVHGLLAELLQLLSETLEAQNARAQSSKYPDLKGQPALGAADGRQPMELVLPSATAATLINAAEAFAAAGQARARGVSRRWNSELSLSISSLPESQGRQTRNVPVMRRHHSEPALVSGSSTTPLLARSGSSLAMIAAAERARASVATREEDGQRQARRVYVGRGRLRVEITAPCQGTAGVAAAQSATSPSILRRGPLSANAANHVRWADDAGPISAPPLSCKNSPEGLGGPHGFEVVHCLPDAESTSIPAEEQARTRQSRRGACKPLVPAPSPLPPKTDASVLRSFAGLPARLRVSAMRARFGPGKK